MPNPLAGSRFYARLANVFSRPVWSILPPPLGFGILTTTGRKTGKLRRQSVRAIRQEDRIVVVAMMGERAQWLNNLRSDPRVMIRLHGGTITGIARETADEAEMEWAAGVYIGTTVPYDWLDYVSYHWWFPTRHKLEEARRRWFEEGVPVIIEAHSTATKGAKPGPGATPADHRPR